MSTSLWTAVTGCTACARRIVGRAGLRQPEVLHLAGLNEVLDRARDILDGHLRIHTVLIQEIDRLHAEPLERTVHGLSDMVRLAVEADKLRTAIRIQLEPELRGDDHLAAERLESLAHQIFVRARAIHLGRVEERDAAFDRRPNERDHLLPVLGRSVGEAHAHAAEAEGRNFQIARFRVCASALVSHFRRGAPPPRSRQTNAAPSALALYALGFGL